MALELKSYRMLVVSVSEKFYKDFSSLLKGFNFDTELSSNVSEARRKCLENSYDFVVVNAPLRDEFGSRFCEDISAYEGVVAVLFSPSDMYDEVVNKSAPHGVFVIRKPLSQTAVIQSVTLLISARERLRGISKKAVKAEDKLEEIRIVNKAKWLLIDNENYSEQQAHRYIEKTAMDSGVSKKHTAQMIIERYR